MIGLQALYPLIGLLFGAVAIAHLFDHRTSGRWRSAAFWALYALVFIAGSFLGDFANGLCVLGIVALAAIGLKPGAVASTSPAVREATSKQFGHRLLLPALVIPAVTVVGSVLLPTGRIGSLQLIEAKQVTLVSLTAGAVLGLIVAIVMLRPPATAPTTETRRLADSIGWAIVLPQMLAALGAVFAATGVGEVLARLITDVLPLDSLGLAVATYCLAMAALTFAMGNAFAAFPVIAAGIGLPILVHHFGAAPAPVAAIGMLSGFCGTLMTPMAANFNIVPAAILELPDRNAVIKVQLPTALILLTINIAVLTAAVRYFR